MATPDYKAIRARVAGQRKFLTRYRCVRCGEIGRTNLFFERTKYKTCVWCQERLAILWSHDGVTVQSIEDVLKHFKYGGEKGE